MPRQVQTEQEKFNQDYEVKKVLDYWQSEYNERPDTWELSQDTELSEKQVEQSLQRLEKLSK
jgi:hypothetical protein